MNWCMWSVSECLGHSVSTYWLLKCVDSYNSHPHTSIWPLLVLASEGSGTEDGMRGQAGETVPHARNNRAPLFSDAAIPFSSQLLPSCTYFCLGWAPCTCPAWG